MKLVQSRLLLLLLMLLPFFKGEAKVCLQAAELSPFFFASQQETDLLVHPEHGLDFIQSGWHEAPENAWVHAKVERKKKSRFLVRHCNFSHHLRKGSSKPFNFHYDLTADPDHVPEPESLWHTRPRYYVFLFRLCPF